MNKFVFKLESILKLKINIENNEKMQFFNMKIKLKNLQEEFDELQKTYEDITYQRNIASTQGTTAIKLMEICNFFKELDRKMEDKQNEINNMLISIDNQSKVLMNVKTEIKTLEKLKEKQVSLYKEKEDKENEIIIEDFIAVKKS